MSDFIRNPHGPCQVEDGVYLTIKNNEHGEIQLHPCTSFLCVAIFVYIPNDGWVFCTDNMMRDRLEAEVKVAIKNKAPGFRPWHTVPLYSEAGEFIPLERRL